MGLLSSAMAAVPRAPSALTDPEDWLLHEVNGAPAVSGMDVTPTTALQSATVFACVRIIAGTFASLPAKVLQKTKAGKRPAEDFYLYPLIHDEPNDELSSFTWRESSQLALLLQGNSYSYISLGSGGRVASLWPFQPEYVRPYRDPTTRELLYELQIDSGKTEVVSRWNMLHVPGLGFDGLVGRSPVAFLREAIGLSLVTERHGAAFFGQGARPGVVLETDKPYTRKAVQNIKRMWREDHGGPSKFQDVSVAVDGLKLKEFSISNEDSQFLQTRGFQVAEIGRIYGVPAWLLNDATGSTSWGSGIESMGIGFVTYTLAPWLRRWEQAMNRILFTAAQRAAGYFVEFNADGLLRGDFHTRMLGYQGAVGGPWMLRNEARRLESFGDIPGGDVLLENLNQSSGPPSPGALAEVTAEGLTAASPPNPAIELAAPSSRAEAFRPLLEATWSRILKRGAQDWPVVAKRGASGAAITDFWTGLDAFAADQLAPVAAALGCDAAVLGLPGSFVCEAHETPAGWDVPVMAREFAARNLETL